MPPFPIPHLNAKNSLLGFARLLSIRIFKGQIAEAVVMLTGILTS